jgi:hypothetical protein
MDDISFHEEGIMIEIVVLARHDHYATVESTVLAIIQFSNDTSRTPGRDAVETLDS